VAIPADTLSYAAHQISIPACPEGYETFIEETSLERLVYWKLQGLFEKFDEDPPNNILRTVLAHVERPLFALVLKKTRGNQSKAAEVLGCNRNTLHRKLKGFSIQPKDLRKALKNKATRTPEEVFEELVRQDS
jgi:DNA-binding protein Fis